MTTTALQTAATLSTPGTGLLSTKTTLAAGTTAVQLHAQLTLAAGTKSPDGASKVRFFLAVSPFDITTAQAPVALRRQAVEMDIVAGLENGLVRLAASELVSALGAYAYVFADIPRFINAPALDLKLVELN